MDDFMSCHVDPKFNDNFKEWMIHNDGKHGKVNPNKIKVHKYLIMTFDFLEEAKMKMSMDDYVERIINELPMKISKSNTDLTQSGNMFSKCTCGKYI